MNKSFKRGPKRRHRRPRTIRKRIFVAGEGKSEVGHIALLQHFAKSQDLSTYLVKQRDTKGGGDPLSILERAINEAKQAEKGGKGFNLNSAVGARQSSGKLLMLNQCLCLESSTMANPFGEAL